MIKVIRSYIALPLYFISAILILLGNKFSGEYWFVGESKPSQKQADKKGDE